MTAIKHKILRDNGNLDQCYGNNDKMTGGSD